MDIERRAIKLFLMDKSPLKAIALIEKYKIPSPYKEVLITVCVERKNGYKGLSYLSKTYGIHMEIWTLSRVLRTALDIFRKARRDDPDLQD